MFSSKYSLAKSRRILRHGCALYKRKGPSLTELERDNFASDLEKLDAALIRKDREESDTYARQVDSFIKMRLPKTLFDHLRELFFALAFAIVFAFLIRQFWFELYEVPTGSMRPTIEELDRLVVSKTTFGINPPFRNTLLFHKDSYIQRAGAIVFTVEDMDVADADTLYFYIFPGKKRYVKRCMAKPGDTVYFYGGRLYGLDREGTPFTQLADEAFLQSIGIEKIDHIPYITMDGKVAVSDPVSRGVYASATLSQMNQAVGKLEMQPSGTLKGLFYNGTEWIPDNPAALKKAHDAPASYSDLWGLGNYAMVRLLTKEQLQSFYGTTFSTSPEAALYLELHHTPNLTYPLPEIRRGDTGKTHPVLTPFTTVIPLEQKHLQTLKQALYTARFTVINGRAFRYQEGGGRSQPTQFDVLLPHVPDGTYEFYEGVGYRVHMAGIRTKLAANHPLYADTPENIQKLFNLGIGFNLVFQPMAPHQPYNPQRFAYFREGDLFVMGAPLLKKDDPLLTAFVAAEMEKQEKSSDKEPYIAFVDHGAPQTVEFIQNFGLKIPGDGVLALGDNYAMSADSRDFGFVPVNNLRGAPSFTFWPPSRRLGPLPQPSYPWLTFPNLLIWSLAALTAIGCTLYFRRRNSRGFFKR